MLSHGLTLWDLDRVFPVGGVAATEVPDGATILDVREDEEWAAGHAPGAQHIPLSTLTEHLDEDQLLCAALLTKEPSALLTLLQLAIRIGNINPWVTATGVFTLLFGVAARKYFPKIPFMISATVAGSLFAFAVSLAHWGDIGGACTGVITSLPAAARPAPGCRAPRPAAARPRLRARRR